MPRAVVADQFGPPEAYELREIERRPFKSGEARVAIRAAGISYVDVLTANGGYQATPPLPFSPGSEAAGEVIEVASDVAGLAPGDRVVCSNWGWLFAEEIVLPAKSLRRVPEGLSLEEAAVFPVSYTTAWHALVDRAQLQSGETVLVLGAGGATGFAAVQIARHLGARVIASAGDEAKRVLATRGGAEAAVDARVEDWRGAVKTAADGRPIDVVFDPVGGAATEPAFRSLGWKGRHLVIGFPAGIASLRTNLALLKGASLVGVDIRQFGMFEPDRSEANRATVFGLAAMGVLRPPIARTYPLEDFRGAMEDAASGRSAGRVVLTMDPPPSRT